MSRFFIHSKTLSYPTRLKKKTLWHIYDTERPERLNDHRHVGHCVHARVVVYMYLIFVMTGQNISAICISQTSLNLAFIIE